GEQFRAAFQRLFERREPQPRRSTAMPPGPVFKAEIQVRTLLQHAWATFAHDRIYKSEFQIPRRWQRDANRVAATLEEADEGITRTIRGVQGYQTYHGPYKSAEERKSEIKKLEAVLQYDPNNRQLAHRIARLRLSLEDWQAAIRDLEPFVTGWEDSPEGRSLKKQAQILRQNPNPDAIEQAQRQLKRLRNPKTSAILLDFGCAQWKHGRTRGRDYIQWAIQLHPEHVDAHIAMANTFMPADLDGALQHYELAFKLAPSNPQALGEYLYCKISLRHSLDFLSVLRPSLEGAIRQCRERARVGVYLPRAFYDIGLFSLLLDRPYESLTAYAKAVQLSDSSSTVTEVFDQVSNLQKVARQHLPKLEWVRRFLLAARVAKQLELAQARDSARRKAKIAKKTRRDAKAAPARCLSEVATAEAPAFTMPVVLVAGGCDAGVKQKIQEYQSLLETAFEGFQGTACSGGTTAGISGLVGELPDSPEDPIRRIAYLPKAVPTWTKIHPAYDIHCTTGERFSALEPLQNWIDLLASGIDPARVRLLGINGGEISAFEFRLAVALGATVGILRDSGRAASQILEDEDWADAPRLISLPPDPQTIRVFVQGAPDPTLLDPTDRENLAKQTHEDYRREKKHEVQHDAAMADWNHLSNDLKNSNFDQVDYLGEQLRAVNMKIRRAAKQPVEPIVLSNEQVDCMAEIEHGRWTVERLLAGWTLGPRNHENKTSPYLVSWQDLPDHAKKRDLEPVRRIPGKLAELGYEIVPDAEA
ncbi:RyR domain-containing protein, partial [Planctomycetota bacterium]